MKYIQPLIMVLLAMLITIGLAKWLNLHVGFTLVIFVAWIVAAYYIAKVVDKFTGGS